MSLAEHTPHQLFTVQTFAVSNATNLAILIMGYRGKLSSCRAAIRELNNRGYCVIGYEHNPVALNSDDPGLIMELIDGINLDVGKRIHGYKKVICVAMSVGVGIGFSLQRHFPKTIRTGVYAGAGVSPSTNIFESPLFVRGRRQLLKRGYTPESLYKVWQRHEITADRPLPKGTRFVIALGTRDRVVPYPKASATLSAWQQAGTPIRITTKRTGHIGILWWFKRHMAQMLDEAGLLDHNTRD